MHVEEREGAHREEAPGTWWSESVRPAFQGLPAVFAGVLVAVVSVWRGVAVAGGHWTQEDYIGLAQASRQGLGGDFLGGSHAGEFSAPARFLVWVVQSVTDSSWAVVALLATFLTAVSALLAWVVLSQVLESRWVRLPLLAFLCFSPLAWAGTLHFTLLLIHLPPLVLFLAGTSLLLRHTVSPAAATGWIGLGALLLLLAWTDQSVFLVVGALLVVLGSGVARTGSWGAGWSVSVERHAGLWIVLAVGVLGRIVMMAVRDADGIGLPDSFGSAVRVLEVLVRQSVIGLVGGPWTGEIQGVHLVASANWPTALAVLLCLAGIVVMMRSVRSVEVRFALGSVALLVATAWVVLVVTNNPWNAVGMAPRTAALLVPAAVLLVAVGLRGTVVPERLRSARLFVASGAAIVLAVVIAVASGPTAALLVPSLQNPDDRDYVDRLQAGVAADPSVVLLDGPVPEGVMALSLGEEARVSTLAPVLPHEPFFDRPSSALRLVDGWGELQPVAVGDAVEAEESEDANCGYAVRGAGVTVPFTEPVGAGTHLVQIDYFTNASAAMTVQSSTGTFSFPVREGLRSVQIPWTTDGASGIALALDSETNTVCVGVLLVGTAVAEKDLPKEEPEDEPKKGDDAKEDALKDEAGNDEAGNDEAASAGDAE